MGDEVTCEVCGREKVVRGQGFQEDRCWRGFLGQDDMKCYRLGYEREKARAEKAEEEYRSLAERVRSEDVKLREQHEEALAAARRECEGLKRLRTRLDEDRSIGKALRLLAQILDGEPTGPGDKRLAAEALSAHLSLIALAAPAAGEEGKR